jgi:carboxymethylenebutenolidase
MPNERVILPTDDGECSAYVCKPEHSRGDDGLRFPAIIFYMDAGGIRPTVLDMAQRLADTGYVVLVPDLFYRYGSYGPLIPAEVFAGDIEAILGPLMATTSNRVAAKDTKTFLSFLDRRADVLTDQIGTIGFCMGGGMAIAAAGTYPQRIKAVASFHGGGLATDALDSPHNYASNLKAEIYIAAASEDPFYPLEMQTALKHALAEANVSFRHEVYDAAHGWMKPDFPVFDPIAAQRGWQALTSFFARSLKPD